MESNTVDSYNYLSILRTYAFYMTAHYINTLAEFPSHTNPYYWIISLLEIGKENTVGCSYLVVDRK